MNTVLNIGSSWFPSRTFFRQQRPTTRKSKICERSCSNSAPQSRGLADGLVHAVAVNSQLRQPSWRQHSSFCQLQNETRATEEKGTMVVDGVVHFVEVEATAKVEAEALRTQTEQLRVQHANSNKRLCHVRDRDGGICYRFQQHQRTNANRARVHCCAGCGKANRAFDDCGCLENRIV